MRSRSLFFLFLFLSPSIASALPRVSYHATVVKSSWEPLGRHDIQQTIKTAVLEVLSKPGLVQFVEGSKADYALSIQGRLLDEAETHTVFLTLKAAQKTDIPSLHTSDTVVLSRLKRDEMLERIQGSARKAAAQLLKRLKPALALINSPEARIPKDPFGKKPSFLWQWSKVRVPKKSLGRASRDLSAKKPNVRHAALRELTSLALTDAAPRNVLERCALKHTDHRIRLGCLVALRPLSRTIPQTQRVVIQIFRHNRDRRIRREGHKDGAREILNEAKEQMVYFGGIGRTEAIQAWVESISKGWILGPVAKLGDLPNLDFAIHQCLVLSVKHKKDRNLGYGSKTGKCLDLVKWLPHPRRRRLLYRFVYELNTDSHYYLERGAWKEAIGRWLEEATGVEPELEQLFWERYQRTMSKDASGLLASFGKPTETLVDRLFEIIQTAGQYDALWALKRVSRENPALRPKIKDRIAEILQMGTYAKKLSQRDFKQVLRAIERQKR